MRRLGHLDAGVNKRGPDAVVFDLFEYQVGGVVAAAPLVRYAGVESSGIEDV